MTGVVAGGVAFLVAGAFVPLLVRFAVGRNLLDVPNLRSSHEVPTPRLGGVAIFLGMLAGVIILGPVGLWPLLAAAALVWAVGLADDLSNLQFGVKAVLQALAAVGLLLLYPPTILTDAPGLLGVLVFAVGVFWLMALSNAFNFMDGIDGFTGGVALVNALFLAPLVGPAGGFLPALIGATAGFLIWNINPASIFIGASGAYFPRFRLAAVAFYAPAVSWLAWLSSRLTYSTPHIRWFDGCEAGLGRTSSWRTGSTSTSGSPRPQGCIGVRAISTTGRASSRVSPPC